MQNKTFPELLYVEEPLDPDSDPFEGHADEKHFQEDDTVAVYELKRVCRVKVERHQYLVDLEDGKTS